MIEPVVAYRFESDPCELLPRVHDRRPVYTHLELAKGAQGNFRMVRNSPVIQMEAFSHFELRNDGGRGQQSLPANGRCAAYNVQFLRSVLWPRHARL